MNLSEIDPEKLAKILGNPRLPPIIPVESPSSNTAANNTMEPSSAQGAVALPSSSTRANVNGHNVDGARGNASKNSGNKTFPKNGQQPQQPHMNGNLQKKNNVPKWGKNEPDSDGQSSSGGQPFQKKQGQNGKWQNKNGFQNGRGNSKPNNFDRPHSHQNGNSSGRNNTFSGNGRGAGRGGRGGGSLSNSRQKFPSNSSMVSTTSSMGGILGPRATKEDLMKRFFAEHVNNDGPPTSSTPAAAPLPPIGTAAAVEPALTLAVMNGTEKEDEMNGLLVNLSEDEDVTSSLNQISQTMGTLSVSTSASSLGPTDASSIFPVPNPELGMAPLMSAVKNITTTAASTSSVSNQNTAIQIPVPPAILTNSAPIIPPRQLPASPAAVNITPPTQGGAEGGISTPELAPPQPKKPSLSQLLAQHRERNAKEIALLEKRQEQFKSKRNAPKGLFNLDQVSPEIIDQTSQLPIYARKKELIELVKANQFVIVIGETGSGKSTQIPQYLAEAGIHGRGKIGVTQPRRVAAKSLAERVAMECGVELGSTVGYSVRFGHKASGDTVIKYMTDGMLVKECSTENSLRGYTVIIIDEAHERSIDTDVCFGLLKAAAKKRKDLKVIISSATLEDEKFSKYFNDAKIFQVNGKSYDVEVIYEPKTINNYMDGAVDIIARINRREPPGDILVFLPGQDEIEKMADMIRKRMKDISGSLDSDIVVTMCYGSLSLDVQGQIFRPTKKNQRKVVLATNIAETSITIDGIVYVIDCGYFKQKRYNAKSGISTLVLQRITKFQAIQRKGRAGRTQPGKCYRLYPEKEFNESMQESTAPEITRSNVESVMLNIISMGISDPLDFDFMDQPKIEYILEAMDHLIELSALDDQMTITPLGFQMAEFPLDPPLAKVVIESEKLGCTAEILKIVALLSLQYQNLFSRSQKDREESDKFRKVYDSPEGDIITLLNVYDAWLANKKSETWCKSQNIQYGHMVEAEEIRSQLTDVLKKMGTGQRGPDNNPDVAKRNENIRKAFTAGYFRQLAKKKPVGKYTYHMLAAVTSVEDVDIHPSSSLFKMAKHPWVIYHEVMLTKKAYMKGVIAIDPKWIAEYAPEFAKKVARFGVPAAVP